MSLKDYQALFQQAKSGDVAAQLKLAKTFEEGIPEVDKNPVRARLWYRLAAENGSEEAKSHLSRLEEKAVPLGWVDEIVPMHYPIKAAGYPIEAEEGVCHGVAIKAIEAGLLGQLPVFDARLHRIDSLYREGKLNVNIEEKGIMPTEVKDWDVLAFLDGVALHFQPKAFIDVMGQSYTQANEMEISKFTSSIALEEEHLGIHKSNPPISSVYNTDELSAYFEVLTRKVKANAQDIAFNFGCNKHSIALIYEAKNDVWRIVDPNELPSKIVTPEQLTQVMKKCFAENYHLPSDSFLLNTKVFSTQKSAPQAQVFLNELRESDEFKESHDLNIKKASYINPDGYSFPIQLIREGNTELFKKIMAKVKTEADFKVLDPSGYKLLYAAAIAGNIEIITALISAGVDLNIISPEGNSVVIYAIESGQLLQLKWLIENGAVVTAGDLKMAILLKDYEMIELLSKKCDVDKNASFMNFALKVNDLKAVSALIQAGALIDFGKIVNENNIPAIKLLIDAGFNLRPYFEIALLNNDIPALTMLLEAGVKPLAKDVCIAFYSANIPMAMWLESYIVQTVPQVCDLLAEYKLMTKSRLSLRSVGEQTELSDAITKLDTITGLLTESLKSYKVTSPEQLQIVQNIYHCMKQTYDGVSMAANKEQADACVMWFSGQMAHLQAEAKNTNPPESAALRTVSSDRLATLIAASLKRMDASVPEATAEVVATPRSPSSS